MAGLAGLETWVLDNTVGYPAVGLKGLNITRAMLIRDTDTGFCPSVCLSHSGLY